ncbi:MAG: type II toxin-antitoxin system RelE family toxin [Gammaproteobacteria bacterium]
MKTTFRQSFARDLKKIKDRAMLERIKQAIGQVETAQALNDVKDLTKLSGGNNYYRIRVGDYRLGIVVEAETVEFVRCLNRREIYRYFP